MFHLQVARVHYPGLESHPEHHIAKRQMSGFGGVISFEVFSNLLGFQRFEDIVDHFYTFPVI